MGFKRDFVKNIANFGSYTYVVQIIEFVSTIILSRLISPEEYGFVALITVFSGFILVFNDVGIRHTIIRNDYDEEKTGKFFGLTIWLGIALFIIFSFLSYPIALFYDNMELIIPVLVVGVGFLTQSLNFVPQALASKRLSFSVIGQARILKAVFQLSLMITLAFLNFSYWALIIPITFSPLVQFVYLYKRIHFKRKLISLVEAWTLLTEIRSLIGSITVSGIINYWIRNADNLVIGKVFGESSLGIYDRAYKFIYMANRLITNIFGSVAFPSLQKLKDNHVDEYTIKKEYLGILGGISLLSFPFGFLLILFSVQLVSILWGSDWLEVARFLPYVGILILTQPLFSATTDFYVLLHKERTVFVIAVVSSSIILTAVLIGAFYSALYILIFTTIAYIIQMIAMIYIGFYKSLNYKFSDLIRFFGPKVIYSSFLVYFIYFEMYVFQVITSILYFVHIVYYQKHDFSKFLELIMKKRR